MKPIEPDELYIIEGRIILEYQRIADILSDESRPITSDLRRDLYQSMRYICDLRHDPPVEAL